MSQGLVETVGMLGVIAVVGVTLLVLQEGVEVAAALYYWEVVVVHNDRVC